MNKSNPEPKPHKSGHCDPECPYLNFDSKEDSNNPEICNIVATCTYLNVDLDYYDYWLALCCGNADENYIREKQMEFKKNS